MEARAQRQAKVIPELPELLERKVDWGWEDEHQLARILMMEMLQPAAELYVAP